jgi:putative cell wall-binding protein
VDGKQDHINAVKDYIKANLKKGGTIYQLGGTAVVPDETVKGLSGYIVTRLWGADRYATNVAILKEAGIKGEEVLVASGTGFADSLSASATGKPILLVKNVIQPSQKDFVATLSGKKFYIIGGIGAVNGEIERFFDGLGETRRIGGSDRYETSVNVARTFFSEPKGAVLAYGANFPDGLCGGSLANAMGGPLLLVANGKADKAAAYAKEYNIQGGAVLGGQTLINDSSMNMIFVS